jgi:NADH dehydrogenase FAD-containing subunit
VRGVLKAKPFAFLNLGLLAYVGNAEAVAQVQFGESTLLDAVGGPAFLLWRSVYLVKQVSTRTRVLVLFDFIKTKIFGRDLTTL